MVFTGLLVPSENNTKTIVFLQGTQPGFKTCRLARQRASSVSLAGHALRGQLGQKRRVVLRDSGRDAATCERLEHPFIYKAD